MAASFFFYDLETSGLDPKHSRIMQFGGQRCDMNLQPIGEPVNVLIKLTPDTLPSPDAILITGITPQQTLRDGITEAAFLDQFYETIALPDTIFVGYNNVRFDDEFVRYLHYRNFYDAYEWHWKNGCSRWDLLDVVRMTRALRPSGIEWPVDTKGKPTNRLEYLTKANHISHEGAHDALADVQATIDVARLLRDKQPDLFNYLLGMRDKQNVDRLIGSGQPFVYTSGHYPMTYHQTSVGILLTPHPQSSTGLIYDLRHDPTPFLDMDVDSLVAAWRFTRDEDAVRLPVKTVKYNRCPAVAPLGVLDSASQTAIDLSLHTIKQHHAVLKQHQAAFSTKILQALERLDAERNQTQTTLAPDDVAVDSQLYDGFIGDMDKQTMRALRAATPEELPSFVDEFRDVRLQQLVPLYKARNFPRTLSSEEHATWEQFCMRQLSGRLPQYFARLGELDTTKLSGERRYLLEELQLYGQSLIPADATD